MISYLSEYNWYKWVKVEVSSMQVGVRSMHGWVNTKIVYTLPDVPFVQSRSALGIWGYFGCESTLQNCNTR